MLLASSNFLTEGMKCCPLRIIKWAGTAGPVEEDWFTQKSNLSKSSAHLVCGALMCHQSKLLKNINRHNQIGIRGFKNMFHCLESVVLYFIRVVIRGASMRRNIYLAICGAKSYFELFAFTRKKRNVELNLKRKL